MAEEHPTEAALPPSPALRARIAECHAWRHGRTRYLALSVIRRSRSPNAGEEREVPRRCLCHYSRREECASSRLHYEVLGRGMVHDDGRGALLRIQQEAGGQVHANVLVRMDHREELGLVFEIRARRIAERVARAAIFLVEEIADVRRIVAGDAEFFADALVPKLGQRFG